MELQSGNVTSRSIGYFALWAVCFVGALCADPAVARFFHDSPVQVALNKSHWHHVAQAVRVLGNFATFTLPVAVGFFLVGWRKADPAWWWAAAFVFLSGALAGVNALIKWIVGRARPYKGEVYAIHPFPHDGGLWGLGGPNQSFPSGDVSLGAATAAALMILFPKWRPLFWVLILLILSERVVEGAHYMSDTVAAVGLGFVLANVSWQLLGRPRVGEAEDLKFEI